VRLRHVASGVLLAASLLACAREARRPPAAPEHDVTRPVRFVPADVDLVLRLDVRRFREVVGAAPELALERLWEGFGPGSEQPADTRKALTRLFESCESLWLGCRLSAMGCRDFTLVLRGQWQSSLRDFGFTDSRNKRDLGGGWLSYDFSSAPRSSIARVYWKPPELAVLVSSAELDAAERAIEQSADSARLEPSEDGLLSLVARSRGLARLMRERSPKGADWLEKSEQVELHFDPTAGGTLATFTVLFDDEALAKRSTDAFRLLVTAVAGFDPRFNVNQVTAQQLGSSVILRVVVPTQERAP